MTTVLDIMTRAARALGYLGRLEQLSAADYNDGFACFNSLLDSWAGENLMSFGQITSSFTLTPGTQQYTVGVGGVVNVDRPVAITQAFIRDTNQVDYPMKILPQRIWNNIGQKNITSQIPDQLFYDPQYPLGIINIFPIPLLAYTVFFYATTNQLDWRGLGANGVTPLTVTTAITMPPGYERAYVFNLAIDMMAYGFPCMLGQKELGALSQNASEAKANIKRNNIVEVIADYDPAIVSRSDATYNIYSDSYPRAWK